MSAPDYRVRRATVDDRRWLQVLWQSVNLPVPELERRLTDFQVIETQDGQLLGAVGLEITGRHGRIHGEAFADFGFADQFRVQLWTRLESLAASHGLVRLWTQEMSPFWSRNGFLPPNAEALRSLPAAWQDAPGAWLTIQLREDVMVAAALEQHLAQLMTQERQRTERMRKHARRLKTFATLAAIVLAIFVIVAAVYLRRRNAALPGR